MHGLQVYILDKTKDSKIKRRFLNADDEFDRVSFVCPREPNSTKTVSFACSRERERERESQMKWKQNRYPDERSSGQKREKELEEKLSFQKNWKPI